MSRFWSTTAFRTTSCLGIVVLLLLGTRPFVRSAYGAYLGMHGIELSDNRSGATGVNYSVEFTAATTDTVGSVEIQFCANSPLFAEACDAPPGFDATNATILSQSGITGFTFNSAISTANDIVISRAPSVVAADQTGTIEFGNLVNPNSDGSYFARISTHQSNDASGTTVDAGGVAFNIMPALVVSSEVPPYLIFCTGNTIPNCDCATASGDFSDLGTLTPTATRQAQSQFMAATNAGNCYSVSVTGTSLTSGNNVINTMSGETSVTGKSQFGLNLRANTAPPVGANPTVAGTATPIAAYNSPNHYRFNDGDVIATANSAQAYRRFTVSYIVNVAASQPPGVYSTTITYVCLANF